MASEHVIPKRVPVTKLSRTHGTPIILAHVVATCHVASQVVLRSEALAAKVASELVVALVDDSVVFLQSVRCRQLTATLETFVEFPFLRLWTPLHQHTARIAHRCRNRNLRQKQPNKLYAQRIITVLKWFKATVDLF